MERRAPLSPTTVGSNLQVNRLRRFVTRPSLTPRASLPPSHLLLAEFISFGPRTRPSNWLVYLSLFRSRSLSKIIRAYTVEKDTKAFRKRDAWSTLVLPHSTDYLGINKINVLRVKTFRSSNSRMKLIKTLGLSIYKRD